MAKYRFTSEFSQDSIGKSQNDDLEDESPFSEFVSDKSCQSDISAED